MPKTTPFRAGIIGSGFAARFHMHALRRVFSASVNVAGVYSPTRASREAFASEYGIASYGSLQDLAASCDVLHLCTPPSTHEAIAVEALGLGKSVIIEKPYTGFFGLAGDGPDAALDGDTFPRERMLEHAMESVRRMAEAEKFSAGSILYAENWVYAPAIQKEREVVEKTGAQILWMHGVEGHSGSHSPYYGVWKHSGGGSLMGKAVHPLGAALYLKQVEGVAQHGQPIRPARVSGRVHAITRMPSFQDKGHLRSSYTDIEDLGMMHIEFDDGTIADVFASELIHGGVQNRLEVHANNHRTICNISPNTAMQSYNPQGSQFDDIYVVEKTGTKEGWSFISPDEDWFAGYQHEVDAFYRGLSLGQPPESGSTLGADIVASVYAAYLSAERRGAEVEIPRV